METSHASASALPAIVLLVEDDADTREMYKTALEYDGYWVVGAPDMEQALVCAAEIHPDIIITDITLSGAGDGVALATRVRGDSRIADVPMLAVTGHDAGSFAATPQLFDAVMQKPVLPESLSHQVRTTLSRAGALRESQGPAPDVASKPVTTCAVPVPETIPQCPACGAELTWSERHELRGIRFDYYRPCVRGCGLFCYNHSERRFFSLTA